MHKITQAQTCDKVTQTSVPKPTSPVTPVPAPFVRVRLPIQTQKRHVLATVGRPRLSFLTLSDTSGRLCNCFSYCISHKSSSFRCILTTRLWTCMSRRLGRCCCHGWRSQSTCASPELKGPTRRGRNRTRGWCMMPWRRCYLPSLSQGAHQHHHAMLLRRLCEFAFPSRHISVTS